MVSVFRFSLSCGRSLLLACAATAPLLSLLPNPALAHSPRWRHERHWHPGSLKAERRWSRAQHTPVGELRESHLSQQEPWRQVRSTPERCNTGRLLGGLTGGAAAYALSRQDGRAWAIPLGALLGSQMGCSVAAGRGPVPW